MVLVDPVSAGSCIRLLAEADARGAYSLALQWRNEAAELDEAASGDPRYGIVASYDRDEILDAFVEWASSRPWSRRDVLGANDRLIAEATQRLRWIDGEESDEII